MNIPDYAIKDKRLTHLQKLLYGDIYDKCTQGEGVACEYSNEYWAEKYDVVPETISKNISKLQDYNYIAIKRERNIQNGYFHREIYLSVDKS